MNLWAGLTGWHVAEDSSDPDNYIRAVFDPNYYSHGAARVAHKGQFTHPSSLCGKEVVVKEFIRERAYLKSDWTLDVETSQKAEELAAKFNTVSNTDRSIHFEDVIPLKVSGNSWWHEATTGVDEWVVVEKFLVGKYTKWLSNNGWVEDDVGPTLPAFSHWTWVETKGQILVCDLQGVCDSPSKGYWLTDPAILSPGQVRQDRHRKCRNTQLLCHTHMQCCLQVLKDSQEETKTKEPPTFYRPHETWFQLCQGK